MDARKITLFALLLAGPCALAQAHPARTAPRSEIAVYGGYSVVTTNFHGYLDPSGPAESGWNAGAEVGIGKYISFAGDFSQYFYMESASGKQHTVVAMAGPRVWLPIPKSWLIRPFADFLVGGAHIGLSGNAASQPFSKNSTLAWSPNGGVDIRVSRHISLRATAGYLHTQFTTFDSEIQRGSPAGRPRVSAGVVYKF